MNGTSRTSRKNKFKVKQQNKNRSNGQQNSNHYNGQHNTSTSISKKQQAMLNAPVKLGEEVLVTIHGIGSSGEGQKKGKFFQLSEI